MHIRSLSTILMMLLGLVLANPAQAQEPVVPGYGTQSPCPSDKTCWQGVDVSHPLPVTTSGSTQPVQGSVSNGSDGVAATSTNIGSNSYNYIWDQGTTAWDRWYGNTNGAFVQGPSASGAAAVGNPLGVGGVANTTVPTPVSTGQRVNAWYTLNGAAIIGGIGFLGADGISNGSLVGLGISSSQVAGLTGVVGFGFNGTALDRLRSDPTTTGALWNVLVPTSSAASAITPVVSASATATSQVLKGSAGNLYSASAVSTGSGTGYCVIINATSAPSSGATITPLQFAVLPAPPGQCSIGNDAGIAAAYSTGITFLITTGTTPYTYTAGTLTGAITGKVK